MKAKTAKQLDREIAAALLETAIGSALRGDGHCVMINKLKELVETVLGHKVHMTVFVNTLHRMIADKRVISVRSEDDVRPRYRLEGRNGHATLRAKLTPAQRDLLVLIAYLHAQRGGRAALVSKADKSLTPRALRALASKGLLLIGSPYAADASLIEVRLTDAGRMAARS